MAFPTGHADNALSLQCLKAQETKQTAEDTTQRDKQEGITDLCLSTRGKRQQTDKKATNCCRMHDAWSSH